MNGCERPLLTTINASVAVRQKVLPLDLRITKPGESAIEGLTRVRVRELCIGCDAVGARRTHARGEEARATARRRERVTNALFSRSAAMTVAGDDAQQTLLPWLRRGLATALTADGATFDSARTSLRVAVELEHTVES